MADSPYTSLKVDLSGQTAIVTGASQGLGKAIALALGAAGAKVACIARSADKLAETVAAITAAGGQAEAMPCDAKDSAAVNALVDGIAEKWGKIDILVNNAGITRDTLLPVMSDDDWDDVIATNLRGCFLFARACSRHMMRARYGRIINMSSVSGIMGNAGQTNYSASKAGLIGFAKALAREVASRNITVNVIAPGMIDTDMTRAVAGKAAENWSAQIPLGRLGSVDDVAAAACFLASDEAAYITGHVLAVNGGMYM